MKNLIAYVLIALAILIGAGSIVLSLCFSGIGPAFTSLSSTERLILDASLCLLFFVQHSGMIRRRFKNWASAVIPTHYYPAFYAITSGLAFGLLVVFWQRTDDVIYVLDGPARWLSIGVSLLAAAGFFWGARSLGKGGFDPLGLGPIRSRLRGSSPKSDGLAIRGPYRFVRHPLYFFVLLLFWAAPHVTSDVLLTNTLFTLWIVVSSRWEERDLVAQFGDAYRRYQAKVPMLLPFSFRHAKEEAPELAVDDQPTTFSLSEAAR